MTAHAAQGKTRPYNVVHLNSCYSHMSYYSSLSRSASAAGTIIIQGFDSSVITKGCSGYLRQEFRELELLDDITRLRYEGNLPAHIEGNLRNIMINQFQKWKGVNYVPAKTDDALRWSTENPMSLVSKVKDSAWHIVDKKNPQFVANVHASSSYIPARGSIAIKKHDLESPSTQRRVKRPRVSNSVVQQIPLGLTWDGRDYSCAYDSLLVILYELWKDNEIAWTTQFNNMNDYLRMLSQGFVRVKSNTITFERLRNHFRMKLHQDDPTKYPLGPVGISVAELAVDVFKLDNQRTVTSSQHKCQHCGYTSDTVVNATGYVLHADRSISPHSTKEWLSNLEHTTRHRCPECNDRLKIIVSYNEPPPIIVQEYPSQNIVTSHEIECITGSTTTTLHLRGIVYHADYHFTARIISSNRNVWYHDGIITEKTCINDGLLAGLTDAQLKGTRQKNLILSIYA